MMKKAVIFFYFSFLLFANLFSQEIPEFEASTGSDFLPQPPADYMPREPSTFNPLLPKVNIISGEYCEEELDLLVAGVEPISYRRFYGNQGYKDQAFGHWRINPECFILVNEEKKRTYTAVGEENGSLLLYEKPIHEGFALDLQKSKGLTNASFSGQHHPQNTRIFAKKTNINQWTKSHSYEGFVEDGSRRQRFFKTFSKKCPDSFQGLIEEDRKPNGNIIVYEYSGCKSNIQGEVSGYQILKSIKAYNSGKTILLGSLDIDYGWTPSKKFAPRIEQIRIKGSDERKATLFHKIREVKAANEKKKQNKIVDVVLMQANTPGKPRQNYDYRWERSKTYFDHPFMYLATGPEGHSLRTNYDLGTKKVTSQEALVGSNGTWAPIARYDYQQGHTIVYDGENNKVIHRYNEDNRITAVETYQDEQLYKVEKNEWEKETGNLISKRLENGEGSLFHLAEYAYDKNHNAIQEKVSGGDGKGDTVFCTFSDDGFNLKLTESDLPGKEVAYAYIPGTNLLSSEITSQNRKTCKRVFHFYDEKMQSVRIKTVIDDGTQADPSDLTGVSYRKIIEVTPKYTVPCVGYPEEVREKTIDSSGNEILLKKVIYTYHPSGKIAREDHYDAKDAYRYSIVNTYDAFERLVKTTDPLGHETAFEYDDNFNLVAQSGPRPDMHKEWVYDLANRPVQEKEWQTDGSILTKERKYDKASRLIASIDECGFETTYEYDSLGRLITIRHPNGAIERKEYDVFGNVTQDTDANDYQTRKEYNFRGQPLAIYYPDGTEEHFTYNDNGGTLATHIDRNGIKTAHHYDIFGHPIKTETFSALGELLTLTTATYSPFQKLSETDPNGVTTFYSYDFAGRKTAEQKGEKLLTYTYDELGRLHQLQEGTHTTLFSYDLNNRLIEKKIEDSNGMQGFQEAYAYDEAGNQTAIKTCEGSTQTFYNSRGEPIQKIDPLGNKTDISYSYQKGFSKVTANPKNIRVVEIYDSLRRLVDYQVKNQEGATIQRREKRYDPCGNQTHAIEHVYEGPVLRETIVHEWIYGPGGRVEKLIEAGCKETSYQYDAAGRLSTVIKPDGTPIYREYDAQGRLSHYFGKGLDYRYTYDCKSRLIRVDDKVLNTSIERAYDIYDHLIKEKLPSGMVIHSEYNPDGQRICLHLPDKTSVHYAYQGPYLYSVSRSSLTHTYSERNLAGKPTRITLPNQSGEISIDWDPALRWKTCHSPYFEGSYAFDEVGNLVEYSYTDALGDEKCFYRYDDLNQLLSENDHAYGYDSLYNRTVKDEQAYALNSLCQVTHDGQKAYTYDANGNLLSDGESVYEYDILDRLVAVSKNTKRTIYAYDAFNRRIAKDKDLYIWDHKNEIGMMRGGKTYELRILGEGLGAEMGAAVMVELNNSTYFPIHDHRGSLTTLVNLKHEACHTYRYTAFGEQLTDDTFSPWRFASKRHDGETGFVYFGCRYYSPHLGRWITPDPQGFKDGPNLYAYVHNTLGIDLYGLEEQNGYWASQRGKWSGRYDYYYDGFCNLGPSVWSRVRTGWAIQWSLLSDPVGHGRKVWNMAKDFASQVPREMNWRRCRSGSMDAVEGYFPKNAKAIRMAGQPMDDYTRHYINDQAAQETLWTILLPGSYFVDRFMAAKALKINPIGILAEEKAVSKAIAHTETKFQDSYWKFPDNPVDLLKELPRDRKGRIYPNDNLRIRPEQHSFKQGDSFNPRHHDQHYHVETRRNPQGSWENYDNIEILKPPGYQSGEGTGFLPGEFFPGIE